MSRAASLLSRVSAQLSGQRPAPSPQQQQPQQQRQFQQQRAPLQRGVTHGRPTVTTKPASTGLSNSNAFVANFERDLTSDFEEEDDDYEDDDDSDINDYLASMKNKKTLGKGNGDGDISSDSENVNPLTEKKENKFLKKTPTTSPSIVVDASLLGGDKKTPVQPVAAPAAISSAKKMTPLELKLSALDAKLKSQKNNKRFVNGLESKEIHLKQGKDAKK